MSDERPGLKIRRRKEDAPSEGDNAADEAAATAQPEPEAAPSPSDATTADPPPATTQAATPAPQAAPAAQAAKAAPAAVPTPAGPDANAVATNAVTASADDSKRSKAWRADITIPRMDFGDEPPATDDRGRTTEEMPTTDDFAAMLGETPVQVRSYEVGEKVSAAIVAIGSEAVFVSLGGKAEGAIDRAELCDNEGELTVKVGDTVDAYVVSFKDGIRLSRALGKGAANKEMLVDAQSQGIPVEGKVTGTNKGGYEVEVLGTRAFCPFSQIDDNPDSQPEDHVGAVYNFLVTRVEEDGRNVVVSRRKLIEEEREAKAVETLRELRTGAEFEGTVTRIADFGAFVDIGGVDGLVHISEMSHSRLDHPSELVRVGDVVRVAVRNVSDLDDPKNRRIGLSMKALAEDPWVAGVRNLTIGETVTGRVVRMEGFGAFVELDHGLDGLVHISEISPGRRINHPREVLSVGDDVQVQIIKIDPSRRQIGLSIKALMDDPWSAAAKEMPIGAAVQGVVDSIQSFGIFVSMPSGINGLLPMSQLPDDEAKNVYNRFRPGTELEVRVLAVDPARQRLTLTRREDAEGEAKQAYAEYQAKKSDGGGMGTFADLLKKR